MTFQDFQDIEVVVLDWLEGTFEQLAPTNTARRADTETPPNLQELLTDGGAFARVRLVTGRDDQITDRSVVDIDCFANSRATAYALAQGIRSRIIGAPQRVGLSIMDKVVTETSPRRLPWADDNIQRLGATYRISARR